MKPRPEEQETIAQYCDRVGCETALAYYLAKAYIESEELGYLHTVKDDIYLGMTGRSKDIALAGLSLYRDRKRAASSPAMDCSASKECGTGWDLALDGL